VLTARRVVPVLVALLAFYALVLGQRGWILFTDGRPAFVLLGVGVLLLPVLGVALVARELAFGRHVQALGRELAARGALPVDDLPRRPSGRVDKVAADEVFARRRAEVETSPQDCGAWFRLALAYDDAGDRARARQAMRRAVALHRSGTAA
jgi:cytochrome c-type biogenesis protein CcmH/NrfG